MKHMLVLLVVFSISNTALKAQFVQQWAARYNGHANSDNEKSNDMYVDASGNVYITGCSDSLGNNTDYTTIKYNTNGVVQWVAKYNGPNNSLDQARSIFVDASGNVYVTGESMQAALSNRDVATIKYNSNGVQQWVQRYNAPANSEDIGESIVVDIHGNVYVAGQSGAAGGSDFLILKYNSAGAEQWAKRYNGTANNSDIAHSIALSPSQSSVYVTGESPGAGTNFDYLTFKLSAASGDTLWTRRHHTNTNRQDKAFDLVVDNSGNVIVTGFSDSISTRSNDYLTIKYDSNGTRLWQRRFNGNPANFNNSDNAYSITADQFNNIYVTGESISPTPTIDIVTVKYSPAGDSLWAARYNGLADSDDRGYCVTTDNIGNVYVTGESVSALPANSDFIAVKYNSSGVEQFVMRYNGPANAGDFSKVIKVDSQGNIYVTGDSNGNFLDMATVKFGPASAIQNISGEIPVKFKLEQNYPNPFNPVTNFVFALPKPAVVKLIVYDMLGRVVETLFNGNLKTGIYKADFNAQDLSSGVYFYKLETPDYAETKKMILVK